MIIYQKIPGHQFEYAQCCKGILNENEPIGFRSTFGIFRFIFARRIFVVTIDNCLITFFIFSILRSAFGMRTVGILIRSNNIHLATIRHRVKKGLLRTLRLLKEVRVINIIDPDFVLNHNLYFNEYIPDLMLYSAKKKSQQKPHFNSVDTPNIENEIRKINFVGFITPEKGREKLLSFLSRNPNITLEHYGAVPDFDGKHPPENIRHNGWYNTNEESEIFDGETPTWCYFESGYDLSSAAFCKSLKSGNLPILRQGSYLESIAKKNRLTYLLLQDERLFLINGSATGAQCYVNQANLDIVRILKNEYFEK